MTEANNEDLIPMKVLYEELHSDDIQSRLNGIRSLRAIALALGEQLTRQQLLPFLSNSVYDNEEDEVLEAIAEQLRDFVPLIGGSGYIHCLFGPLEFLATVEECVVRQSAIDTLIYLAQLLSDGDLVMYFLPMVQRLARGNWFTSRASAAGLVAVAYKKAGEVNRGELCGLYRQLCVDDTPMVRRAAAYRLGELVSVMVKTMSVEEVKKSMLPLLTVVSKDEQDSVRLHSLSCCVTFSEVLSLEDIVSDIVPIVKEAGGDRSWRVRRMLADNILKLQSNMGTVVTVEHLVPLYASLLDDSESEIKSSAVSKIKDFSTNLPVEKRESIIMNKFFPLLNVLIRQGTIQVKTSLASQMMCLAPLLSKANIIKHLIPIFLIQLLDENPDVRLNVICNLESVSSVIGVEQLSVDLLPVIVELCKNNNWRVRLAIIEYLPLLGLQLGLPALNDDVITGLCIDKLNDTVFSVREAAVNSIKSLVAKFGIEWAEKSVLPKMIEMSKDDNYLHRMICLLTILRIGEVCDAEVIKDHLLEILVQMSLDKVPNVRFKTAQILAKLGCKMDSETVQSTIRGTLDILKEDSDRDVAHFALQAIYDLKLC